MSLVPNWSIAIFTDDPDDGGVEVEGTRVELDAEVQIDEGWPAFVVLAATELRVPGRFIGDATWLVVLESGTPSFTFRPTAPARAGDAIHVPEGTLMRLRPN